MRNLIKKYREDRLSSEEASILKNDIASLSEDQFSKVMFEDWKSFDASSGEADETAEDEVWDQIVSVIDEGKSRKRHNIIRTLLRAASVILIVLLGAATGYFYYSFHNVKKQQVSLTTGVGEQVSVTMPDGSVVTLAGNSKIEYCIGDFNDGNRRINFSGIGYFDIRKDSSHPFMIESEKLEITVKGTKFNLEARNNASEGCIYLIEGNVEILSKIGDRSVSLHADEKAIVNYSTGDISVTALEENDNPLAWQSGRLMFNKATFGEVASMMKKYYGDRFSMESSSTELFTGVIPIDNLEVANDIIRTAFAEQ